MRGINLDTKKLTSFASGHVNHPQDSLLVPMAGLEPAHIAAADFESAVSAIPPHRHILSFLFCRKKLKELVKDFEYTSSRTKNRTGY